MEATVSCSDPVLNLPVTMVPIMSHDLSVLQLVDNFRAAPKVKSKFMYSIILQSR